MNKDKVQEFIDTTPPEFVERVGNHANDLSKMMASPEYALLNEMWDILEASFKHNAVEALELSEREDARYNLLAIRAVRGVPVSLYSMAKALVSAPPSNEGTSPE
jgi:hypothetical protein